MKQIDTQVISRQRDEWYPKKKVEFLLVIQIAFPASISGHSPVSVAVTTCCCLPGSRYICLSLRLSSLSPIPPLRPPLCHCPCQVSSLLLQPLPSSAFYACCSPFFPNPFSKDHCRSWVFFMPWGKKQNNKHQSQKKHCIPGENFICNTVAENCEQNTNKTEDSLWTSLYSEPQVIKRFTRSPVCT